MYNYATSAAGNHSKVKKISGQDVILCFSSEGKVFIIGDGVKVKSYWIL